MQNVIDAYTLNTRQANLEQERLELQALNSERFRHRFLERNRPWILQHLTDLLTPRTLQNTGPDGQVFNSRLLSGCGKRKL